MIRHTNNSHVPANPVELIAQIRRNWTEFQRLVETTDTFTPRYIRQHRLLNIQLAYLSNLAHAAQLN